MKFVTPAGCRQHNPLIPRTSSSKKKKVACSGLLKELKKSFKTRSEVNSNNDNRLPMSCLRSSEQSLPGTSVVRAQIENKTKKKFKLQWHIWHYINSRNTLRDVWLHTVKHNGRKKEKRKKKLPSQVFFNDFIVSVEVEKFNPWGTREHVYPCRDFKLSDWATCRSGYRQTQKKKGATQRLQGEQHAK